MQCPQCKAILIAKATKCHACGYVLPASVGGTLDPSKYLEPMAPQADSDAQSTQAFDSSEDQDFDSMQTSPGSDAEGTMQLMDASEIDELAKIEDGSDLNQTANFSQHDSEGTMDFGDSVSSEPSEGSDLQATVLYGDSPLPTAKPSDATVDFVSHDATLLEANADSSGQHGTVEYDSKEIAEASGQTTDSGSKGDSGSTGSAGRLNRIWGGAGGSGSNPMHTLKGGGAMASDSIFERVANRVLLAEKAQTIIEKDVKKVADREAVQRCLQMACQSSAMALADYHVNGFLGKGGMGIVMQARQSAIGRDVALKMILPGSSGSQSVSSTRDQQKKFLYEAQVTGKLDHPNIVPVYDLGVSNGVLFYSMKKIIGKEWTDRMPEFSLEENLDVWMKVADAMAFSHQRSIIHRDLKPDNVMLGPFGEVLVTDWGCAVDLSLKEKFNGAGSPPWMAPEMAAHRQEKIGTRSDIYLLGAILYQIIQGYPPHPGRTAMEVLRTAATNQIIPVEDPDPLMKIAMHAMETQPDDRYETVEEMQEAIRQYRRHSESIALTERSDTTLTQAIGSKDYERFSRAVFGFQDALELWPENNMAAVGLCKARYAYGECAYARKDYDLCLATLDRSEPDENSLYLRAEKAKQVALQRENRLKVLWKALAAVILLGLAGTSIAAGVAWIQRNNALAAKEQEEKAKEAAQTAQQVAERAAKQEELARIDEEKAKLAAQAAEMEARTAEKAALAAAESERKAKIEEEKAKLAAREDQKRAELAAVAERKAKEETEKRTAQVELAGLQSNLSLALGQVEQLDVGRANELLANLAMPQSYAALAEKNQLPLLENWAWKRINLLTNRDLLQDPWGQQVTALAYATQANVGAIATTDLGKNRLQIIRLDRNRMVVDEKLSLDLGAQPAESILMAPDGSQVVYSVKTNGSQASVFRWKLTDAQATPIDSAQSRSLQGFVASSNHVVGGLNNGLWVWKNSSDSSQEPERITEIQGRLLSIQLIDDSRVLVLAQMSGGQRYPHIVSLDQPEQREFIRVDTALKSERLSAVGYSAGRLVLGTESGKLFSSIYAPGSQQSPSAADGDRRDFGVDLPTESLVEIPQQHISAIKSISVHNDGTLLTLAHEPLVHLWKVAQTPSGFRHEERLTGTTQNIHRAAFISNSDHILAVSEDGRSIVWDALRQRQRQRVHRVLSDGRQPANYDAAVVSIVPCEDHQHAVSILENGRIDRWNTQTGMSVHQADVPMAFIGHDPNAQFVDMAIDEQAEILITSARVGRIGNSTQEARSSQSATSSEVAQWNWEFVKWDLRNGRMLDRWNRTTSEEQTVSLSNGGRFVLYGSDSDTLFQQPSSKGITEFTRQDFGSYQGYVHPRSPNLMMLVKLNGVVRVIDTEQLEKTWDVPEYQLSQEDFFRVATKGDRTILGRWSPNGSAFYVIWDSGRVTELQWSGDRLSLGRDLHLDDQRLDLSLPGVQPDARSGTEPANRIRIGSRWNIDMKVRSQEDANVVITALRFPGSEGWTRLSRIIFPNNDSPVSRQQSEAAMGRKLFVLSDTDSPRLEVAAFDTLRSRLPGISQQVAGSRTFGSQTFVATREGNVYRVSDEKVEVFGRPRLLSGTGDRTGNTIITLHEGGVLWRGDWQDDKWSWKQLSLAPPDAQQVSLSPDGSQLVIRLTDGTTMVSAETGETIQPTVDLNSIVAMTWQPSSDATMAVALANGDVQIVDRVGSNAVGNLGSRKAQSIHFFHEAWNDPNKPASKWLVVHCQSGDGQSSDELVYLSLDEKQQQAPDRPRELSLPLSTRPTVVTCSPQEGLLAVGGQGTVTLYMAAPSLEEEGKELFSLSGHSGAELRSLKFTGDGRTLISADSQNRIYGWLSEDALQGVTEQMAMVLAGRTVSLGNSR